MRDFPPTNERRSQGLLRTYERSPRGPSAVLPRKSTPNTPRQQPNRYKTLPTRPKRPISASFARAGRTLYRTSSPTGTKLSPLSRSRRSPGTKLSQHAPASSPTGTKLSQHAQKGLFQPVLHEQGELCTASTTTIPSRENFVPLSPSRCPAGRTLYRAQRQTRYKTLPVQPVRRPNRYKILPTRPKRPISARFTRAGRTLYRSHPHAPQQGELCTALTITMPSRENFVPRPAPNPVQNSPNTPTPAAQPVQNSPNTPKIADFSPFYPSRENFVPLSPPRPQQGELSTAPSAKPGTKLSQHAPASSPPGTKLSQHAQKGPFQPVLHEQGELCTASTTTTPAGRTLYRTSSPTGTKLSPFSRSIGPTGTKLSQHAHTSSPPGTKLSPHAPKGPFPRVLAEQGELYTASTPTTPSRENFVPHPEPNPAQNSPSTPTPAAHPVQNSPNTHKKAHFHAFWPSRENFVPPPPPRSRAGRTLYRRHHQEAEQGELCTAPSAKPGTKLSQHTRSTAVPRKSSPSTPKNGVFRLFRVCRANYFAHKQATSHAGRIISRTGDRTGSADEGRMR